MRLIAAEAIALINLTLIGNICLDCILPYNHYFSFQSLVCHPCTFPVKSAQAGCGIYINFRLTLCQCNMIVLSIYLSIVLAPLFIQFAFAYANFFTHLQSKSCSHFHVFTLHFFTNLEWHTQAFVQCKLQNEAIWNRPVIFNMLSSDSCEKERHWAFYF